MSYRANSQFRLELIDKIIKAYAHDFVSWCFDKGLSAADMLVDTDNFVGDYRQDMSYVKNKITFNYTHDANKLTIYLIIRADEPEGENTT